MNFCFQVYRSAEVAKTDTLVEAGGDAKKKEKKKKVAVS